MTEIRPNDNRLDEAAPVGASPLKLAGQLLPLLRDVLQPQERRSLRPLALLHMLDAVLGLLGVASVLPFLALVANPGLLDRQPAVVARITAALGLDSSREMLIAVGLATCVILVMKSTLSVSTQLKMNRWGSYLVADLGSRLLERYLAQPWSWFLDQHTANLSKRLLSDVYVSVNRVIQPLIRLTAQLVAAALLIGLLIVVDPVVAVALTLATGGIYGLLYLFTRGWLLRMGQRTRDLQGRGFRVAHEALSAIKELKILGREAEYVERFRVPAYEKADLQHHQQRISAIPSHVLRVSGFVAVVGVTLWLLASGRETENLVPVLGVYVVAGLRLLPAMQGIFQSFTQIRAGLPSLETVAQGLTELGREPAARGREPGLDEPGLDEPGLDQPGLDQPGLGALELTQTLAMQGVTYRYPNAHRPSLVDLNLAIAARSTVAFIGRTGAGKTTAVDLLLGLLTPTLGNVVVDGQPLIDEATVRRWQSSIGYVPQQIMVVDATVAQNVALGVPDDEIDLARVEAACRAAALHDFVTTRLPYGYDTLVGERGIRLSGGQRQRIGIARALYRAPSVLVFDEATSAVDNETERAILEAVEQLRGQCTIILIAHRLTTVRDADRIFLLEEGRLIAQGTWNQLSATSPAFQRLSA